MPKPKKLGLPLFSTRRRGPKPVLAVRVEASMLEDLERLAKQNDADLPDVVREMLRWGIRIAREPEILKQLRRPVEESA